MNEDHEIKEAEIEEAEAENMNEDHEIKEAEIEEAEAKNMIEDHEIDDAEIEKAEDHEIKEAKIKKKKKNDWRSFTNYNRRKSRCDHLLPEVQNMYLWTMILGLSSISSSSNSQ